MIHKLTRVTQKFSPHRLKILANTAWLFADRVVRMGASLVVGVWVARYLGTQQFGLFNYVSAFAAIFSPIANLGLDNIVIRRIMSDSANREQILGTTFWLKLFASIGTILLAVSAFSLSSKNDVQGIYLIAILATASIFQAFDTIDLWFQSQVQSKYTVLARNTAFIVNTIVKVVLISVKAPLVVFAWVSFSELGMSALLLCHFYKTKGYSMRLWSWNKNVAQSLVSESWPLILSGLSIMIYMKIDQIMLGKMLDNDAVGTYSAAARISEVWYFIPTAIVSSVSPSIYAAKENSEKLYYQRIGKLQRLLVLISIVISVPMTFMSGIIISTLYGSAYTTAEPILAIHIWASLFVFMGVATSPWFIAENLNCLSMYRTLIGAVSNVILNLVLIPKYAGVGAAVATVISYSIAVFFSNMTNSRTSKIFKLQIKSFFLIP